MILETERLYLIPLTAHQLKLWIYDTPALEKELNCSYRAEPVEGIFLDIVKKQYEVTMKDEANYLYHSFWFILRKSDRIVVGSAALKDVPNPAGEIEIGYGLGEEYQHNGYMTEAVKALCTWAMNQASVSHVIAETEIDSIASQHILERCGFKLYSKKETLWWKL